MKRIKQPFEKLNALSPSRLFTAFFNSESIGGIILLFATILSMILANSNWGDAYSHIWHQQLDLSVVKIKLDYSVEHWINDGLMAVFFLLVGLEIERELYVGELKDLRNAALPVAAAMGGMLIPALIHLAFNSGSETQKGIGIPMATDIAFALGMLSLLGKRVPASLKVFLTALAIIDDLGAILVIAIFYNEGIQYNYLLIAGGIIAVLILFNLMKWRPLILYLIPGIILWFCMLKSGIHATIAGVLLAFLIPYTREEKNNPSYILQDWLHKPVAFIILPVFAMANTSIQLGTEWFQQLSSRNSLGIIAGLFIGKMTGILAFSWFAVKMKWGNLSVDISWKHLWGAACLAGIGFTMSIFIANLAFDNAQLIQESKIAVLAGSIISVVTGLIILRLVSGDPSKLKNQQVTAKSSKSK